MTTIYHNPLCSKSRQTLALIKEKGINPTVVHYLETPLKYATITSLLGQLGLSVRDIIRTGEDIYKELQLNDPSLSEKELVQAIIEHPKLLERPIVVKDNKAVIGRPPENVLTLL